MSKNSIQTGDFLKGHRAVNGYMLFEQIAKLNFYTSKL